MTPSPAFGFEQLVTEMLRGLIEAVADRPGETEAERFARQQTAVFSAMAFMPRDAVETMLASQCVMLDHLLRDGTRDLLRGQPEPAKLRLRSQLTAMGRLFLKHLDQLRRLQARSVEQIAVSPNARAAPETASRPPEGTETGLATISPLPAAANAPTAEPAALEPSPESKGKSVLLQRRGFQNRRLRRAAQFNTPSGHARQHP